MILASSELLAQLFHPFNSMRFLVTNDDGIDAPGLRTLEEVLRPLGELLVIAPDRHLSGCSHQATTDRGMSLLQHSEGRHALEGTPVDCARIGLIHLAAEIDWVISGINEGGNLGADVYHSGTVAAVREAALLGKPGIAVSQYRRKREPVDWQRAARWTAGVIRMLLARPLAPGRFFNVNLPDAVDQPGEAEWSSSLGTLG
jgi:5'-nucleotidase